MAEVEARGVPFLAIPLADLLGLRKLRVWELVVGSSMSTMYELEEGSKLRRVSLYKYDVVAILNAQPRVAAINVVKKVDDGKEARDGKGIRSSKNNLDLLRIEKR